MMMTVGTSAGRHIEGTICWPTLANAITKFRGDTKGRTLTFVEYEVVQGADQVEVPTKYEVEFDAALRNASGRVLEGEAATLTLESLSPLPATIRKPTSTPLNVDVTIAADASQQVHLQWKTAKGELLSESVGVARREGSDLIITEIASSGGSSAGAPCDPKTDALLANTLLPCTTMN